MLKKCVKHDPDFVKHHCDWVKPQSKKWLVGNRQTAIKRLDQIDPIRYCRTRNFLDGAVTYLSGYIRHGILSLNEVRNKAIGLVDDSKKIVVD